MSIYVHELFEVVTECSHSIRSGTGYIRLCAYCTCKNVHCKIVLKDYLSAWRICILPQQARNKSRVNFAHITLWLQFLVWCSVNRNNPDKFLQCICDCFSYSWCCCQGTWQGTWQQHQLANQLSNQLYNIIDNFWTCSVVVSTVLWENSYTWLSPQNKKHILWHWFRRNKGIKSEWLWRW